MNIQANTPAAPAAAPAEPAAPAHTNLQAILQGYNPETQEATEAPPEQAEVEAEPAEPTTIDDEGEEEGKAKADPAAKPPKKPFNEAELFTDEALAKPEGLAAARQFLRNRNAKMVRREMAAERRAEGLERKATELTQALERVRAIEGSNTSDWRVIRSGAPARDKIAAIGRIAGGVDGLALLEELNVELANNERRQDKPSQRELELEKKLERLEQRLEQGSKQQQEAVAQRMVHQIRMQIVGNAREASEEYPHLAEFASSQPDTLAEAIGYMKERHHAEHGRVLDDAKMFGMLEEHLAHLRGGSPAAAQPNAGAGQATGAGKQPAKPGSGRGARPPNGKTISPGLATQTSGAQRDPTEDEIIEAAAKDDDWLGSIFPSRRR